MYVTPVSLVFSLTHNRHWDISLGWQRLGTRSRALQTEITTDPLKGNGRIPLVPWSIRDDMFGGRQRRGAK